ncbi:MAG TPA: LysR substrate-binding domain-containing protein [Blastocatellia bacterium]|nr:LysR substrate-binding domain-containing protein [Blastocatellia bacterium]
MALNLEVRHLRLVETVAREGGITKAAHRLHVTQSALSHQLRDIEDKLGTPLFLRLNKRMLLTQAGERLLTSAPIVLEELKRAEEDIRQIAAHREGILRISTECYTCYHWLPRVLTAFNREFPRVEVRIVAEATRRPIEALLDGRLDVAITSDVTRNQKIKFKPLFKDEMVVIASPDHPLAIKTYVSARDFASEHLLVYAIPKEDLTVFQKILVPAGVSPKHVSRVELTEAIIEMVKAGLGIGVMARWAVWPHIESGALVGLPITVRGLHRLWHAAILRHKVTPPYLLRFVELLSLNPMAITKDKQKQKPGTRSNSANRGLSAVSRTRLKTKTPA